VPLIKTTTALQASSSLNFINRQPPLLRIELLAA
jgi:hypothetical protein